jgi:histidyl-tRNA synthetase
MDGLESLLKTLLFTEVGRKHAEGWMFLVAGVISFLGWISVREISNRIRRIKEEAQRHLNSEKVMHASCRAADSSEITDATIQQEGDVYILTVSVKNSTTDNKEKKQRFNSLDALAAYLEMNTVLRLGDFR